MEIFFFSKTSRYRSFSFSATTDKSEPHLGHNRQKLFPTRPQPAKIILLSAPTEKNYSLPGTTEPKQHGQEEEALRERQQVKQQLGRRVVHRPSWSKRCKNRPFPRLLLNSTNSPLHVFIYIQKAIPKVDI